MSDLINKQKLSEHIRTRLFETALNNVGYITTYDKVCEDIAVNRIDIWINEVIENEER